MKLRISLLTILIDMLFTSYDLSAGKVAEQKEEGISVLKYNELLGEYVHSNGFSAIQELTMNYRQPTKVPIEGVLPIGMVKDDTISQRLQKFYSDNTLLRLLSDVEAKCPNPDEIEKGLTKGSRKLRKGILDAKIPFIYSQIPAFNKSITLVDTLLEVSPDKYMGEDYPLYKRFYYDYQCTSIRPERVVPNCFALYLLSHYEMNYHEDTYLVDLMIRSDKIDYVVQHLLGYNDISQAMEYSDQKNEWCRKNEEDIWGYIYTNDHLHARNPMVIRYCMEPAPAVDMLRGQAPALIGSQVEAQIIASYMEEHKDLKIKGLLELTDYQSMFEESGYLKLWPIPITYYLSPIT